MGKQRRKAVWLVVGLYVGTLAIVGPGCATGNEPTVGDGNGGDDTWGAGSSTSSSGAGGSSSSSASSSSGKPCSSTESCNGIDDDCNGLIDDNVVAVGNPCNTGLMGVCGVGAIDCQGGKPLCIEKNSPMPEVCDNLDNDCNGQVDDNASGGGDTCMTGLAGPCGLGVITCMSGAFACVQQTQAVVEICGDTVDNDCNGTVDNGCGMSGCAHDPCVPGGPLQPSCAPCVTDICNIDSFCCTDMWDLTCYTKALDMCPGC